MVFVIGFRTLLRALFFGSAAIALHDLGHSMSTVFAEAGIEQRLLQKLHPLDAPGRTARGLAPGPGRGPTTLSRGDRSGSRAASSHRDERFAFVPTATSEVSETSPAGNASKGLAKSHGRRRMAVSRGCGGIVANIFPGRLNKESARMTERRVTVYSSPT